MRIVQNSEQNRQYRLRLLSSPTYGTLLRFQNAERRGGLGETALPTFVESMYFVAESIGSADLSPVLLAEVV